MFQTALAQLEIKGTEHVIAAAVTKIPASVNIGVYKCLRLQLHNVLQTIWRNLDGVPKKCKDQPPYGFYLCSWNIPTRKTFLIYRIEQYKKQTELQYLTSIKDISKLIGLFLSCHSADACAGLQDLRFCPLSGCVQPDLWLRLLQ